MLLRRQTPKVGAGCSNWARPDPCGGCPAMGIPTAILDPLPTFAPEFYTNQLVELSCRGERCGMPDVRAFIAGRSGSVGLQLSCTKDLIHPPPRRPNANKKAAALPLNAPAEPENLWVMVPILV